MKSYFSSSQKTIGRLDTIPIHSACTQILISKIAYLDLEDTPVYNTYGTCQVLPELRFGSVIVGETEPSVAR